MPLFYDTAGIPIQLATPQVNYGALANVRPLSFGQNPIQISANAQWVVPEGKPYIAQGIGQAAQGIAHGMDVAAQAKREEARQKAAIELEGKKEETASAKEEARQTFEAEQHRLNRENALEVASVKARHDAVSVPVKDAPGFLKQDEGKGKAFDKASMEPLPSAKSDSTAPLDFQFSPLVKTPAPTIPWQISPSIVPLKADTAASLAPQIQEQAPSTGATQAPVPAPAPVSASVPAPVAAPVKATSPTAVISESIIPHSKTVLPANFDLTNSPDIGSKEAGNSKTAIDAVKNTPELGKLEDVQPHGLKQKPIEFAGSDFQEVNPEHRKVIFEKEGPAAAFKHAADFNNLYRNSAEEAVVKGMSKEFPYYTVEYRDVSKERLAARERAAAHKSTEEAKAASLEFKRDAKVGNMAKSYEADPFAKLMATREDTMGRMLVAYEQDQQARKDIALGKKPTKSLSTIHQEMKELFVMFASGKAPTESQFKEINHAFPGFDRWYEKKKDFFNKGATLDQVDVNTIKDLMVETYNNSANNLNKQLSDIDYILKKEHPNIDPIKLPVKYPTLETEEHLKSQLNEISKKAEQNPKLKESLKPEVENLIRKIEYSRLHGLPANFDEFRNMPRKPGFHSYLFSASTDLSNAQPALQ